METLVIVVYGIALSLILLFGFSQLGLIIHYLKSRRYQSSKALLDISNPASLPFLTIQLPIFNERFVVERLLDKVAAFDYPASRFEIQVLDDSTDDTTSIINKKIEDLQRKNIQVKLIHRTNRAGYKAGALAKGLEEARGELIAIFDADFIPEPDFLRKTIPSFDHPQVGMVQTKWGHINENYSILTKLQAFGLNAHFTIEQTGRNKGGHFMTFNGTAGIWRKKCIEDAGGWQHDTIAEDMDLSYRAQLKGWQFIYRPDIVSPAELPIFIQALKNQQFRWTKGGAENFKKLFMKLFKAPIPFSTKVYAISHLMNNSIFILILLTGLFSIPALFIKANHPEYGLLFKIGSIFVIGIIIFFFFYWFSFEYQGNKKYRKPFAFAGWFFLYLSYSMGLSLHNTFAAIGGYLNQKSAFVRTPKFNITSNKNKPDTGSYIKQKISPLVILEGLMAIYFLGGIAAGIIYHDYGLIPFHLMFFIGFSSIFYYSVKPHNPFSANESL